jgi:hypothetical protein
MPCWTEALTARYGPLAGYTGNRGCDIVAVGRFGSGRCRAAQERLLARDCEASENGAAYEILREPEGQHGKGWALRS